MAIKKSYSESDMGPMQSYGKSIGAKGTIAKPPRILNKVPFRPEVPTKPRILPKKKTSNTKYNQVRRKVFGL